MEKETKSSGEQQREQQQKRDQQQEQQPEQDRRILTDHELDMLANAGKELPKGLDYAQTLYFLCMRKLYDYAKTGNLDPEQGKREKQQIQRIVRQYRLDCDYVLACARRTMAVERAATAYRKAGSDAERLQSAAELLEALDGMMAERVRA